MYGLIQDKVFSDFSLISVMTGIKRILTDRPLIALSDDHNDLEALSLSSIWLVQFKVLPQLMNSFLLTNFDKVSVMFNLS